MGYLKKTGEVSKQIAEKGIETTQRELVKRSDDEIRELVKRSDDEIRELVKNIPTTSQ